MVTRYSTSAILTYEHMPVRMCHHP
jgi:hypothetical protein